MAVAKKSLISTRKAEPKTQDSTPVAGANALKANSLTATSMRKKKFAHGAFKVTSLRKK